MRCPLLLPVALISSPAACWPINNVQQTRRNEPSSPSRLVDNLKRGESRFSDGISIVPLSEHERGVAFSGTRTPGKELAFISAQEFVTSSHGRKSAVGRALTKYLKVRQKLYEEFKQVLSGMFLAIFLCLVESKTIDAGEYAAYVDTLPTLPSLFHLPVFWSEEELNELQCSQVRYAIEARRKKWTIEHQMILDAIASSSSVEARGKPSPFVSLEKYFWARSIILSRTFESPYGPCLVPFVDMLNHNAADSHQTKCDWVLDRTGFFLTVPMWAVTTKSVEATPLEISYGAISNGELLMAYGFSVLDDALQDIKEVGFLNVYLYSNDTDIKAVWENDGNGDCPSSRVLVLCISDKEATKSLLSMCRVASCQNDDLSEMKELFAEESTKAQLIEDGSSLSRQPYSVSNEIAAMKYLQKLLCDQLSMYPTSIREDEALLQGVQGIDQNARNAIIVRRGEKRVLEHFFNLSYWALAFLTREGEPVCFNAYKELLSEKVETAELIFL